MRLSAFHNILLLAISLSTANTIFAQDFISERAYYDDLSAGLNFADVHQQAFTNYAGLLSRGFGDSAIWLRLRVERPNDASLSGTHDADKLILRVKPGYLDRVQLFDPAFPADHPRLAGDLQSWAGNEHASINHAFVIPALPRPRDIFLRLTSTSTRMIYPEVLTVTDAARLDRRQELLSMMYLGFLALSMAWALINWLTHRDRIVGLFVLKQTTAFFHAMAVLGFNRILLADTVPALWIGKGTNIIVVLFTFVASVYEMAFLREFKPDMRLWRSIMLLLPAIYAYMAILLAIGKTSQALQLNLEVAAGLFACLIVLLSTVRGTGGQSSNGRLPLLSRRALFVYYGSLCVAILLAILPGLGWVKGYEWALNNFMSHGLVSGLGMIVLLQMRAHKQYQIRQQALLRLELAERQIQTERSRREEQSAFLSMLAHELKTPLSVMRMVMGAPALTTDLVKHGESAVRNMNDVIERCLQVGKLEEGKNVLHRVDCQLSAELRSLQSIRPDRHRLRIEACSVPCIRTDIQILRVILANLIDNAMKYSPRHSPVIIRIEGAVHEECTGVAVTVRNEPGIAGLPDPSQVFQKYYRDKRAHALTGSGLGLYLSRQMAELLDGHVGYLPDEGYVTFRLWLPA